MFEMSRDSGEITRRFANYEYVYLVHMFFLSKKFKQRNAEKDTRVAQGSSKEAIIKNIAKI